MVAEKGQACHRNFVLLKKCPWIKIFRKILSHPNKICPTPKFSEKDEMRAKASLTRCLKVTNGSSFVHEVVAQYHFLAG